MRVLTQMTLPAALLLAIAWASRPESVVKVSRTATRLSDDRKSAMVNVEFTNTGTRIITALSYSVEARYADNTARATSGSVDCISDSDPPRGRAEWWRSNNSQRSSRVRFEEKLNIGGVSSASRNVGKLRTRFVDLPQPQEGSLSSVVLRNNGRLRQN